jgi:hypothetical protein
MNNINMSTNITKNIDTLSINISNAFKKKYQDIDANHYAPSFIKDFIIKSKSDFTTQDGVQKIISSITKTLNSFRDNTNKERQTKGVVDFSINPASQLKTKPIPQQKLVAPVKNDIQYNKNTNGTNTNMKTEFLNKNPLIIDSGMVSNTINQKNNQNVYLNHIESNNMEYNPYKGLPGQANQPENNLLSSLSNLPNEINNSDRFILTDKQKNLVKEETGEWIYYLVIDSKDRDMNSYKSPNEYTIRFSPPSFSNNEVRQGYIDRILHNVKSIELVKCAFLDTSTSPDSSDFNNIDPAYVILEVEEFGTNHNGTNQFHNKSLAILDYFTKQGKYKYYNVDYNNHAMINRFNPRVTIDKMTIRFRLPDGSLYNFGNSNNTNLATVNYILFKVNVVQRVLETNYLNQADG